MINNTYKEFQADTSEKIADFGTKSIQKRGCGSEQIFQNIGHQKLCIL